MAGDKVGTGYVPIKPDADGFGPELEKQLDKEGVPAAERSAGKMQQAMKGVFLGGAAVLAKSVMDFAGFEQGMNEVFTLMPGISGDAMKQMEEQVKSFSTEFGVLPTETVPALYEALGAGVPADNVFEFLEQAQMLAKGGVTDLATAVDGLSSVTNAYGADVISAGEASDIMFKIVGLGKGTLDDVAGSLFQVTPIASAMGVAFEDVGAAMAVLSAKGTPVSVAATQIRSVLGELGKDGTKVSDVFKEMSGKTFTQFIAEGGNLGEALQIVQDGADKSGLSVMDLFGSIEAGSAALSLLEGDAEAFTSAIGQMENAAGSTEAAYDQMNQGLGNTMKKLKAQFAVTLLNIGEQIAPTIGKVGEALGLMLEMFSKIPGPLQATIVLVGTLAAGLFAFAGPILKGIQLFKMLGSTMTLLAANPWILVLAGLIAVTVLIVKNWDTVKATLSAVWGWMKTAGQAVADFFVGLWRGAVDAVTVAWNGLADFFRQWWPLLLGIFTGGIGLIVGLVIQNWDAISAKVSEVAGAIVGFVQGAFSTVWGIVSGVGGQVVGFITGIPNAITSAFGTLAAIISTPFTAAFAVIKTGWNSTVGGFGFDVPGWVPGLGGKGFRIPTMAAGGVASSPMLAMIGEYAGAAKDPEVVAPQSIIRETVTDALRSVHAGDGMAGGIGGLTVNGPLIGSAVIRDERDATTLSRELARDVERRQRAAGNRSGGVNA